MSNESPTASPTETAPPAPTAPGATPPTPTATSDAGTTSPPGAPSAEQLQALEAKAAKADEHWDKYVRAMADLENYRKRAVREKQEASRFANEALLNRLLPVLDSFDLALSATNGAPTTDLESLQQGVAMIQSQLRSALAEAGVEEIDALGQPFDPNFHEAVSQRPSSETPDGHVLQQLRRGYRYRERLLRPASVVVATPPAPPPATPPAESAG
ncbi:MAG: nucleotide exchange factor GrpE [Verrucomicrobia bacterium]|nr:nucleotide exchange factor GrpE [Verrucomicrobiota bacterium]